MFNKIVSFLFVFIAMFMMASAEPQPSGIIGAVGIAPAAIAVSPVGIAAPIGIAAAPIAPIGIIGKPAILG